MDKHTFELAFNEKVKKQNEKAREKFLASVEKSKKEEGQENWSIY